MVWLWVGVHRVQGQGYFYNTVVNCLTFVNIAQKLNIMLYWLVAQQAISYPMLPFLLNHGSRSNRVSEKF